MGWVHWFSAHLSISSVVVALACKMIPSLSFPFPNAFNNCMVCSGLPHSCLLLRMCNAYADIGLFVFICRMCSRCLILIELPVWPTCDLLHVLHCGLCIKINCIEVSRPIN